MSRPSVPSPARRTSRASRASHKASPGPAPRGAAPADALLRDWLQVGGSLTRHLRAPAAAIRVHKLFQGRSAPLPGEAAQVGPRLHAREVVLERDGRALVFARSITASSAVRGPWRALLGLGTRPLAELLFTQRGILRSPLLAQRFGPGSAWMRHIRAQCREVAPEIADARVLWGRSSLFVKHGRVLRVLEVFAPGMPPRADRRGLRR